MRSGASREKRHRLLFFPISDDRREGISTIWTIRLDDRGDLESIGEICSGRSYIIDHSLDLEILTILGRSRVGGHITVAILWSISCSAELCTPNIGWKSFFDDTKL